MRVPTVSSKTIDKWWTLPTGHEGARGMINLSHLTFLCACLLQQSVITVNAFHCKVSSRHCKIYLLQIPIDQVKILYVIQTASVILRELEIQMAQPGEILCSIYSYPLTEINTKVWDTLLHIDYKEFHVSPKNWNSCKKLGFMEKHTGKGREHTTTLGVLEEEG